MRRCYGLITNTSMIDSNPLLAEIPLQIMVLPPRNIRALIGSFRKKNPFSTEPCIAISTHRFQEDVAVVILFLYS